MTPVRIALLALIATLTFGCASGGESAQVGERGPVDRSAERAVLSSMAAEAWYDSRTPKTGALINSSPPGALVEWLNRDNIWVTVGSTPSIEIVIEATGKPELVRVSMPGYMSQSRWIAATPGSRAVAIDFQLQRELPTDRRFLRNAH
jgi:histidinol-phosphate/aromatic aminotransferase/cobyric acid decarboxylase-like protein